MAPQPGLQDNYRTSIFFKVISTAEQCNVAPLFRYRVNKNCPRLLKYRYRDLYIN